MRMHDLLWYQVNKEDLPALMFGVSDVKGLGVQSPDDFPANTAAALVGFARAGNYLSHYHPPVATILRQADAAETLSWLRVYSRDTFPLSQFVRVLSADDWRVFADPDPSGIARSDRLACVVLGEILAQGDREADLANISLSRGNGCFSWAVSRSILIHGRHEATRICTDRLRNIENDAKFSKRNVAVSDLVPIWSLVAAELTSSVTDGVEVADMVVETALEFFSSQTTHAFFSMREYPLLRSDSVEDRVSAFQDVLRQVEYRIKQEPKFAAFGAVVLAASAFLVGRGTSHAFLLQKKQLVSPVAFAWFGLMAALAGPKSWDAAWSRVAKGIERHLRTSFCWDDPQAADICWTEYEWLARTLKNSQGVTELTRTSARTLSIEVIPGAACQFRIATTDSKPSTDAQREHQDNDAERELRTIMSKFVELSLQAQKVLTPPQRNDGQLPLLGAEPIKSRYKRQHKRSKP